MKNILAIATGLLLAFLFGGKKGKKKNETVSDVEYREVDEDIEEEEF